MRRHPLEKPQTEAQNRKGQDGKADIRVNIGRGDLVRRQRFTPPHQPIRMGHAIWKQKVEEDQKRHRPVKDTLRSGEGNLSRGRHFIAFYQKVRQAMAQIC